MKQITVRNPKRIKAKRNQKKIALGMITPREIRQGVSLFDSLAWWTRNEARKDKELAKRTKIK